MGVTSSASQKVTGVVSYRRDACRLCATKRLELVYPIGPIALSDAYRSDAESALLTPRVNADVFWCESCGHVQQLDVVHPEVLWGNFLYESGASKQMRRHLHNISGTLKSKANLVPGDLVVDVGSNDGTFLRYFQEMGLEIQGVDPAKEIAQKASGNGIPTEASELSSEVAQRVITRSGHAQLVTAFNVFGHVDDLETFMKSISVLTKENGYFAFECQYLPKIIANQLTATFFHEHISHHSLTPLVSFFRPFGFSLIDAWTVDVQHGSIVGVAQKNPDAKPTLRLGKLIALEEQRSRSVFSDFLSLRTSVGRARSHIQRYLKEVSSKHTVNVGVGASRSLPTLMRQFELEGYHEFLVDSNANKIGKFEPSSGLEINRVEVVRAKRVAAATLFAWVPGREIIRRNKDFVASGGSFLRLCPKPAIINRHGTFHV